MDRDPPKLRLDQKVIVEIVTPGASVLDLGCGRGELLAALAEQKQAKGQGIEIDDDAILRCVSKGLNVFHDDIDRGLPEYGDRSFDFVILDQTFQQVKKPDEVLRESLRVGAKVIVGFPNFATLSTRLQLGLRGRTPAFPSIPAIIARPTRFTAPLRECSENPRARAPPRTRRGKSGWRNWTRAVTR